MCCPFSGCSFETNLSNSFTEHVSQKHKNHDLRYFRPSVRDTVASGVESNDTDQPSETGLSLTSSGLDSTERADCVDNVDAEILEHKLASLFLRMQCMLHVSKSAIQAIVEEFHDILSFFKFHTSAVLKEVFAKHNIEIEEEVVQEISNTVRYSQL